MEYSVGSIADLISGKNTPNKAKVVQKSFTPTRISNAEADEVKVKTPKGKKSVSPKKKEKLNASNDFISLDVPLKAKRKSKSIDNDFNVSENSDDSPNKKKKKKKGIKREEEIKNGDIKEDIAETKVQKKKFKKEKIKVETSDDSNSPKKNLKRKKDAEDSTEESPSKPKKTRSEKNAGRRVLNKERQLNKENPEDQARTIFVGNIPLDTTLDATKKKLKQHFRKYGIIDNVRIRGIPVADPKTSKKLAAIKSKFNPNRKTVYGFIKFKVADDAVKAQEENSKEFNGHHLRVHVLNSQDKPDESKAIFIGNLGFDAIEDDLWKIFEPCGEIDNIRIVRDGRTGMGKGFAYINFINSDSVQLALEMENVKLKNRELRISLCNLNKAKKLRKKNKVANIDKPGKPKNRFRKFNKGKRDDGEKNGDKTPSENKPFQGSKFSDKNKKKKLNKGELQKKKLIKKIAPKAK